MVTWKFEVIVGTEKNACGDAISPEGAASARSLLEYEACESFGGFSRHVAAGGWKDPSGNVVCEASDVWVIFGSDPIPVESFAKFARAAFAQIVVCVVYPNNEVKFIEG